MPLYRNVQRKLAHKMWIRQESKRTGRAKSQLFVYLLIIFDADLYLPVWKKFGWMTRSSIRFFFLRPGAELGQLDLVFGFLRTWKLVGQLKGLKCIWFHQNLSVYIATKRNWCKILYTIYFKWFCRLGHLFILSSSWLRFSTRDWWTIWLAYGVTMGPLRPSPLLTRAIIKSALWSHVKLSEQCNKIKTHITVTV